MHRIVLHNLPCSVLAWCSKTCGSRLVQYDNIVGIYQPQKGAVFCHLTHFFMYRLKTQKSGTMWTELQQTKAELAKWELTQVSLFPLSTALFVHAICILSSVISSAMTRNENTAYFTYTQLWRNNIIALFVDCALGPLPKHAVTVRRKNWKSKH